MNPHTIAVEWPAESEDWNREKKQVALRNVNQLVERFKGKPSAYVWSEYFNKNLDIESSIVNIFGKERKIITAVISISAGYWNEKVKEPKLKQGVLNSEIASPRLVDESGEILSMEVDQFEANGKAIDWFQDQKMKWKVRVIDNLKSESENWEHQLVRWVRNRNWQPMIRKFWLEWLK